MGLNIRIFSIHRQVTQRPTVKNCQTLNTSPIFGAFGSDEQKTIRKQFYLAIILAILCS